MNNVSPQTSPNMPRSRAAAVGGLAMTSHELAVKLANTLKHTPSSAASKKATASSVLHPGDKTKPRFLIQLAHFMSREFRILGVEKEPAGDPRRLQVCRQAFHAFIDEFKTYENLLNEIKNEYEATFLEQRAEIERLLPFKSKWTIAEYESSRSIEQIRSDNHRTTKNLMTEIEELKNKNSLLRHNLDASILKNDEMSEQLLRMEGMSSTEEFLKRKVSDLQLSLETSIEKYEHDIGEKNYELVEKNERLKRGDEMIEAMTEELTRLRSSDQVKVTQTLHNEVVEKLKKAESLLTVLKHQTEDLTKDKSNLDKKIREKDRKISQLMNDLYPDWDYIQSRTPTPITDLSFKCKGLDYNDSIVILIREFNKAKNEMTTIVQASPGLVPGGGGPANTINVLAHTDSLKSGKYTGQDLEKLKEEFMRQFKEQEEKAAQKKKEARYFIGLGVSTEVPKHLRFKGKIPNRNLSKRDCCLLIKDIWNAKVLHDAGKKSGPSTLEEFLHLYLKKRFGAQDIVAEWGYNIHEGCRKNAFQSSECQLFFNILSGESSELLYHHLNAKIEEMKNAFHFADANEHDDRIMGFVSKEVALRVVSPFYKNENRTAEQLNQVKSALDADQAGAQFSYKWLFQNHEDSMLVNIFREHELESQQAYIRGLDEVLKLECRDEKVTANEIARAMTRFDPAKPKSDYEEYLRRGLGLESITAFTPKALINRTDFFNNLKLGVLTKGSIN